MSRWNPDAIASHCTECDRNYIEYMREQHEIDLLAARDPEPQERLRRDFAAWVEQAVKITTKKGFMSRKHPAIHCLCDGCKKPFRVDPSKGWKAVPIITVTEEVNWFRGDDEVRFYHPECEPKK